LLGRIGLEGVHDAAAGGDDGRDRHGMVARVRAPDEHVARVAGQGQQRLGRLGLEDVVGLFDRPQHEVPGDVGAGIERRKG